MKRYLPRAPVIIEAGAHDASDTAHFARLHGDGSIHAFEPDPATLRESCHSLHGPNAKEWTGIDGMWLDMQGYELSALKGAGPLLDSVRALILEISAVELYEGCTLWPDVREWLTCRGFRIQSEWWSHETFGDALAVRAPGTWPHSF